MSFSDDYSSLGGGAGAGGDSSRLQDDQAASSSSSSSQRRKSEEVQTGRGHSKGKKRSSSLIVDSSTSGSAVAQRRRSAQQSPPKSVLWHSQERRACIRCARRKIRCDRNTPCDTCVRLGLAHTCRREEESETTLRLKAQSEALVGSFSSSSTSPPQGISPFLPLSASPTLSGTALPSTDWLQNRSETYLLANAPELPSDLSVPTSPPQAVAFPSSTLQQATTSAPPALTPTSQFTLDQAAWEAILNFSPSPYPTRNIEDEQ